MKVIKVVSGGTFLSDLTASDFAEWIKADNSGDPADIAGSLFSAASYVEKIAWTPLSTKTITFVTNDWGDYEFDLEFTGTLSSPTCSYFDTDNASQTLTITSSWLERTDTHTSTLHVVAASYPSLYDRADAITITISLTPFLTATPPELKRAIYLLGAYYYDCRVNDKEVVMTVVDKIVAAVRQKEY